jgi:hypothetical protein
MCSLPLAAYTAVVAFAVIAYFKIGHWPSYGQPDPSALHLPLLRWVAVLAYPVAFLSAAFGCVAVPLAWPSLRKHDIGIFFSGVALWIFTFPIVRHLWDWLAD